MPLFRRTKTTIFEARQWTVDNDAEMRKWLGYSHAGVVARLVLCIENRDGRVRVNPGEWIVRDDGFYPMTPEEFAAEYEAAT
jgi:hypothetical protein